MKSFKKSSFWIILIFLLISVTILSISFGSVNIDFAEIMDIILGKDTPNRVIFMNIRLPRVIFSIITGINLAVSGLLLQIVLKNPMADPGILGISSGASLGAILVMLILPISTSALPLVAFLGGVSAFLMIMIFSWNNEVSPVRLILAGVAVNAMIGGIQSTIMTMYSDKLQGVINFLNGNLSGKTWIQIQTMLIYSIPIFIIILLFRSKINILNLPDNTAYNLGINIRNYRLIVASLSVFLASITVSQVGLISFVGLVVPHLAKIIVGGNFKKLFPTTILMGPILVVFADFIARMIVRPLEIPIATVMAIVGGPYFLYLLHKQRGDK
ncbi:MAG: iron ABC transporter permease [Helcococcus sp.]|nr:iron ABC transporter permease [Helcococcus sp.]